MRTLVFDVHGEYGLFKKPYSPMSPVSYPVPPPPAVLGMLGAILGYGKREYAAQLDWPQVRIGVGLRAPLRTYRAALNLLQTRVGTDRYFRPLAGQNVHTQIPFEFLRQPAFRLYVAGLDAAVADTLAASLRAGYSAYTVSLGLAPCLAELAWVGEWPATTLTAGHFEAVTAVPVQAGLQVTYEDGRRYQRVRLPAAMDAQRVVHRYQEIVVAADGGPIRGEQSQACLYSVGDSHVAFL